MVSQRLPSFLYEVKIDLPSAVIIGSVQKWCECVCMTLVQTLLSTEVYHRLGTYWFISLNVCSPWVLIFFCYCLIIYYLQHHSTGAYILGCNLPFTIGLRKVYWTGNGTLHYCESDSPQDKTDDLTPVKKNVILLLYTAVAFFNTKTPLSHFRHTIWA